MKQLIRKKHDYVFPLKQTKYTFYKYKIIKTENFLHFNNFHYTHIQLLMILKWITFKLLITYWLNILQIQKTSIALQKHLLAKRGYFYKRNKLNY